MSTTIQQSNSHIMESASATTTTSTEDLLRQSMSEGPGDNAGDTIRPLYAYSAASLEGQRRQHIWWKSDDYKTSIAFNFQDKATNKEEAYNYLINYYGRQNIVAAKMLTNQGTEERVIVIEVVLASEHLRNEARRRGMNIVVRSGKCWFRGTRTLQPDAKYTVFDICNLPLENPYTVVTKVRKAIELSYAEKAENVLELYAEKEPVGDIYEGRIFALLEGHQPVPGRQVYISAYNKFYSVSFSFM
ncbi:hypothetical protein BDB00DRAFT_823938 [Zychaea mexicana]|uniref:uncharacterized protein n=1 Tax=Zychaea mexicana TaxID=64656 RepID=UPI0022FE2087|nr:uncharacterized protein BDB00DRAFT_823938 [Zychaea mexicana]KAI9493207.1 hypothetical protein BDB00DRAFT_823938 [Zychaea mexicana]